MAISADQVLETFPRPRAVTITHKLNVREQPHLQAARVDRFQPARQVQVDGVVRGDAFQGVSTWFRLAGAEQYFWSGGAALEEPGVSAPEPSAAAPAVRLRANGTILPLSSDAIRLVFGSFETRPGAQRGAVVIATPGWQEQHIEGFRHPAFGHLGDPRLPVHRLAVPHLRAALDGVVAAGLQRLILTCDGTFVARHKNWDPAADLSSHSWGIAMDLNARWNGAGRQPALPGDTGCLRELVPFFTRQGFAWGGHFSSNVDGMHFELARTNP